MDAVIIGSGGRLGAALAREWRNYFQVHAFDRAALDLARPEVLREKLSSLKFDTMVNCAALTNVDYCETHPEEAHRINAEAPQVLAEICQQKKAKLIHISTDYVFDGSKRRPYRENDEASPAGIYAKSKLVGEQRVLEVSAANLVVRMSWVFGPDRPSFIDQIIARARASSEAAAIADKFSTPTYTIDAANWLRLAWEGGIEGILHLANGGECSWQEYGQYALDCCAHKGIALEARKVAPLKLAEMRTFVAQRPAYSVLATGKFSALTGVKPRDWQEAVADYIATYIS